VDRTRTFALELAKLSPDVILAAGTSAIAALKQTTQSIPLVYPDFLSPTYSAYEQSMHHWVKLPSGMDHFPKARPVTSS
jgi:ABC-type uncharacterized transport system substrate-binding protein